MDSSKLLAKILIWRVRHIKQKQFVLMLSLIIGVLSGLSAVLLKNIVHYIGQFLTQQLAATSANLLYFAYPLAGIFLTVLYVRFFVKDNIGHGVSRILLAISKKNSNIKSHNTYSSMIASTFTVAFGGSVGLEAPIVLTGSSLGSNIGKFLHLNYKTTTLLIGCGAAGALAAIFKAPIAALIFGLEVLMLDLTMSSIIPLMISAVTGAMISNFLLGKGVIFSFTIYDPFILGNIPYYIILGILSGFVSLYFTRGNNYIEEKIGKIANPYQRLLLGGVLLGLIIFLFPPLYGEGYDSLRSMLGGNPTDLANQSLFYALKDNYWIFLGFLLLVLVFKVIAMAITTSSGGVGGIFAPALFMGGVTGFIIARVINALNFINVSERNFALVGMAGIMAGVMHAPLTAIFLIAEITGGYGLFIPLIVTATISYLTIMYFEPHSIYTRRLAKRGELITHHKDKAVLTLLKMGRVIEKDLKTVHPENSLGELVKVIAKSKRNIFPVIDDENKLIGIVLLDNIREIIFNSEMYDEIKVEEIMVTPPAYTSPRESMESVMHKFEDTGAWNLPVVHEDGTYEGFISKSKIFNAYRRLLVQFSDE